MKKLIGSLLVLSLFACGEEKPKNTEEIQAEAEPESSMSMAVTQVPGDAYCLRVTVTGSFSVTQNFNVTPGSSSVYTLEHLPVGFVDVSAETFWNYCEYVTPDMQPTWFSTPQPIFLYASTLNYVTLSMVRNGQLQITVDFVNGDAYVTPACADGTAEQAFYNMVGCAGSVTFPNRASLCGQYMHVCSAAEWNANFYGIPATHSYWTNDALGYDGAGPDSCLAGEAAAYGCPENEPMRVCAGPVDPEGNYCNWYNCGYNAYTPNTYLGGCYGNLTAGTVCCY